MYCGTNCITVFL